MMILLNSCYELSIDHIIQKFHTSKQVPFYTYCAYNEFFYSEFIYFVDIYIYAFTPVNPKSYS